MNPKQQPPFPMELRDEMAQRTPEECRQLEHVWELLGQAAPEESGIPSTDSAWDDLQQRLHTVSQTAQPRRGADRTARRSRRRIQRSITFVASFLVLMAAGLWWWQQPVVVQVPYGMQQAVTLPDGSVVELNSGSQVTYQRGFQVLPLIAASQRTVTLEGEGFFEVEEDGRPFRVETFNSTVEVLGTSFNVKARSEPGGETQVAVATGRVRVTAQDNPAATVVLEEAGAATTVGPASASLSVTQDADLERILVWRQQGFYVVNQPLSHILSEVERRFNIQIETEAGIALTDSVNLFYGSKATAENIIHDLCLAHRCRYRQTNDGFVLLPEQP